MLGGGGADPKGLEGRPQGEEGEGDGRIKSREFFWDSITLYVVYSIIGLTAIDVVTEFIRGTGVQCFSRGNQSLGDLDLQDYVNDFCSSALPNTEFFPTFTIVHGILIAIPHYLWLNHFGGSFDFFFQLASSLERLRDEESGHYPDKNFVIVEQLEGAFSTYKQNSIYRLYLAKLILQWIFTVAGFVVAIIYFTNFDANFICPLSVEEACDNVAWPLDGEQVMCVFTSLRLLELIRVADLILLTLAILCLTWSLVWCFSTHSTELGHKSVAEFTFQSGLASRYYVPKFPISRCLKCLRKYIHKLFTSVPWLSLHGPRISTDLDFMMMKLFRTDGGLGHVLKEVQVLREIKSLNDDERIKYNLHRREQLYLESGGLIEKDVIKADLKWVFEKGNGGNIYNVFQQLPRKTELVLPDSIRGAVLGFASRAEENGGALCISFGSPSLGFTDALGRVFSRVGFINFNPYYRNPKKPVECVVDSAGIVSITCCDDILSGDSAQYVDQGARDIWCPGYSAGTYKPDKHPKLKTNFIVVSPIDKALHKTAVNLLFELLTQRNHIANNAVLLTLRPLEIAGKDVRSEFLEYDPPKTHFTKGKKQSARVNRTVSELLWPPGSTKSHQAKTATQDTSSKAGFHELKSSSESQIKDDDTDSDEDREYLKRKENYDNRNSHDLSVLIGDAHSRIKFSLFSRVPPESDNQDLANLPLSDSESSEDEEEEGGKGKSEAGGLSHEDVQVKMKKISNISATETQAQQHTTVTLEYSDTKI